MTIESLTQQIAKMDPSTPLSDLRPQWGADEIQPHFNGMTPTQLREITATINALGRGGLTTISDVQAATTQKLRVARSIGPNRINLTDILFNRR